MRNKIYFHSIVVLGIWCLLYQESEAQESGKIAYETFGCFQCHGYVAQGGGAGLRLAPNPMEYEDFIDVVRRPYGVMPAYSSRVMSDRILSQIYSYIKSIREPPPLEEIPLLQLD